MSLLTILDTLLIGPLKLLFEIIFVIANRFLANPGLSIIALSLMMNILVLPLYRRADAMQEEARDIENKLAPGVAHIKKAFSGDERMMILQTYYRQNNYKPTDALKGSVSLLLEVPFFMAAYQFLSGAQLLEGTALGPIADLGAPDGLIVIGSLTLNALPILMTLINVVSSAIYLKGFPIKTKLQLYGMALFFLVFLYDSPSGLVFYWTLNNLFSLAKTIFYKLKNAKRIGSILLTVTGLSILFFVLFLYHPESLKRKLLFLGIGLLFLIPLFNAALQRTSFLERFREKTYRPNNTVFLLSSLFLTILTGLLIPSAFIASSPQEFVDPTYYHNPLWYLVSAGCLAAGTFLIWMRMFYWLSDIRGKVLFERITWAACGIAIVNYMFFGTNLGNISPNLQYEVEFAFSRQEQLINFLVVLILAAFLFLAAARWTRHVKSILLIAVIALGCMSAINVFSIRSAISGITISSSSEEETLPSVSLSKTGKNVVVIMLDRAQGLYVPYIFEERPELKEQFSGFTYYSNVISYGNGTKLGAPAALGGYEYTPVEMNRRNTLTLCEKHNEALLLMPVLFSQNGYQTSVWDPSYPGYEKISDMAIYEDYPEISVSRVEGTLSDDIQKQFAIDMNHRNFFCLSLVKSMPLFLQSSFYYNGQYNQLPSDIYLSQATESPSRATGISKAFMDSYDVLRNLPEATQITDSSTNTFLHITNNITHAPTLLQMPDYTPASYVDNTEYDAAHADRFTLDDRSLADPNTQQMSHYHVNMATMLQLGSWFDYLKEQDVYDNTRIILVADHGWYLSQEAEELIHDDGSDPLMNVASYFPLLMVKDFDADGFTTSDTFMTNADVPTIALEGLIENPVNPFTGNAINSDAKTAHDQFVLLSWEKQFDKDGSTTYQAAHWASITDNIWEKENWTFLLEDTVLAEHSFS